MKKKLKYSRILFVVAIIIVIILIIVKLKAPKKSDISSDIPVTQEEIEEEENKAIKQKLMDMNERDRMNYYFGIFLNYIENGENEKAYDLLYDEFKQNYFPTLESFEEYVSNNFSEMMTVEYSNIERNGDVYVLWINILDAINGNKNETKELNVVIKENDYNDFVMSFSVKEL